MGRGWEIITHSCLAVRLYVHNISISRGRARVDTDGIEGGWGFGGPLLPLRLGPACGHCCSPILLFPPSSLFAPVQWAPKISCPNCISSMGDCFPPNPVALKHCLHDDLHRSSLNIAPMKHCTFVLVTMTADYY